MAYEEEAEEHAAEVCHVGYSIAWAFESHDELYDDISHDEPFRLDREWDWDDKHLLFRVCHTEGKENTVYTS